MAIFSLLLAKDLEMYWMIFTLISLVKWSFLKISCSLYTGVAPSLLSNLCWVVPDLNLLMPM